MKLAYHVVCHGCAYDKKVCPKCLLEKTVIEEEFGFSEESITEFLKNKPITERQRRMLLRKWDNEEITGAQVKMAIERLTEGKNTKIVVQVQSGDDDFEDDDEGDKDVDADNDDADNKNNATDSEVGDAKECATGDNAVVAEEKSADSTQQKDDEKDQ